MVHRFPPPPKLGRQAARLSAPDTIAIFCEGATEAECLKSLRAHWRRSHVSVHVVGQVGDPKKVVEEAKRFEMNNRDSSVTIIVVFDRDEHPRWYEAMSMALARRYIRAVSNPCIELYGLLLHRDQYAAIHRHDAQRELSKLHKDYHHKNNPYFDIDTILQYMADAERRAADINHRAAEDGDPFSNPSTTFSEAIRSFRP